MNNLKPLLAELQRNHNGYLIVRETLQHQGF